MEAKFVKLVEERGKVLGQDTDGPEATDEFYTEDNFLSFGGKKPTGAGDDDEDFIEMGSDSDDEDAPKEEEIKESYGRSTYELLVVIYESIVDNFEDFETPSGEGLGERILETLYREKSGSVEVNKAIAEIEKRVLGLTNVGNTAADANRARFSIKKLSLGLDDLISADSVDGTDSFVGTLENYFTENQNCEVESNLLGLVLLLEEKFSGQLAKTITKRIKRLSKQILVAWIGRILGLGATERAGLVKHCLGVMVRLDYAGLLSRKLSGIILGF